MVQVHPWEEQESYSHWAADRVQHRSALEEQGRRVEAGRELCRPLLWCLVGWWLMLWDRGASTCCGVRVWCGG